MKAGKGKKQDAKVIGADKLLKQIMRERGHVRPWHKLMAREDARFLAGHEEMMAAARSPKSPLPRKVQELILFSTAVAMDAHPDTVASHVQAAREAGATDAELLAAVQLLIVVRYSKPMRVGVSAILDSAKKK